jgi:hypothetical protein
MLVIAIAKSAATWQSPGTQVFNSRRLLRFAHNDSHSDSLAKAIAIRFAHHILRRILILTSLGNGGFCMQIVMRAIGVNPGSTFPWRDSRCWPTFDAARARKHRSEPSVMKRERTERSRPPFLGADHGECLKTVLTLGIVPR